MAKGKPVQALVKLQVPAGYSVKQAGAGKEMAEQFAQIFPDP